MSTAKGIIFASLFAAALCAVLALAQEGGVGAEKGRGQGKGIPGGSGSGEKATSRPDGQGGRGGGHGRVKDAGPVVVRVENAAKKLAPRYLRVVALLQGRKQTDVYSKVTGRIVALGPAEGEPVKQGQILFRVDRSDPGESFLDTPVSSPITGWVGRWSLQNVGEQVTPVVAVVTVLDDLALRATAQLPAGDWLGVSKAVKVKATLGSETRDAAIVTVARAADPVSGRGGVTVEIDNPKREWRAGLYATLSFELDPRERMLISAASLIITDKGSFVYIIEGETARRIPVTYEVYDSDTVEIRTGLSVDAKVVSAGANLLGDKSTVRVVDAPPPAESSR